MTHGWFKAINHQEAHYFVNDQSLCGAWVLPQNDNRVFTENPFSKENCTDCRNRFMKGEHKWPEKIQEGLG